MFVENQETQNLVQFYQPIQRDHSDERIQTQNYSEEEVE